MPSPPDISIEVFGKTDVGLVREHNEDNFLIADVTGGVRTAEPRAPFTFKLGEKGAALLVCDGMGGAAAGEVASQMAVDSIFDAMASSEPQDRDGFAACCAGRSSTPTSASSSSRATTRANAAWAPPARWRRWWTRRWSSPRSAIRAATSCATASWPR
jgi:hypothetical protein